MTTLASPATTSHGLAPGLAGAIPSATGVLRRPYFFQKVEDWLDLCKVLVQRDYDDVILFTGAEGKGKSTVMYQVMRYLDPDYSLGNGRVFFAIEDFLEGVRQVPRYGAAGLDEALANHRKGMHGEIIDLLDDLQISRGRNHHVGICFPHDDMLDKAILNYRIRWNVHVSRRGFMTLRRRVKLPPLRPGGDPTWEWSRPLGVWRTAANDGPEWEAYKRAKDAFATARRARKTGVKDDADPVEDAAHHLAVVHDLIREGILPKPTRL